MEGHITIYGEIIPWQDDNAGDWGAVNLKGVMAEVNNQPEATEFVVHIHSPGGHVDEAFAIYDALKSTGKPITAMIEGLCASSATIIALAATERKMTENSEFMIHMPFGGMFGDSEDMQKAADMLKAYEEKVLNLYVEATGGDREAIYAMMKEETFLSADQAKQLGFVTEMIPTMKAVARINLNKNTMPKQMTAEELDTKMDGLFQKIMKVFKPEVKMITVTAADGTILDFGDAVTDESQIVVGATATVDGSPAEGEYVMTDGRTLVFSEGAITEIREEEGGDTVEEMQAKLDAANAKIAELESAKNTADEKVVQMEGAVETMKEEFKTFKAEMKSDLGIVDPDKKKTPGGGGDRKPFK